LSKRPIMNSAIFIATLPTLFINFVPSKKLAIPVSTVPLPIKYVAD